MHARAGAQQGLFTGDDPIWLPFPVASVSAAFMAVLGAGAALIKRASTGYGQHVETSLLDALLFLNAAAIFHREGHRPRVIRHTKSPILRVFDTSDGRAVMVNLSGTERWRELCRLLGMDDGGLDYSTPEGLSKLSDREWNRTMLEQVIERFGSQTADEWEGALLRQPAAVAKCNSLAEWLASEQARVDDSLQRSTTRCWGGCRWWARRCGSPSTRPIPADDVPDAGTAESRARSVGTASSTSPPSGPDHSPRACWPSWVPTS